MGLSFNEFVYAGSPDFDLNFALGYSSKQDVTCIKTGGSVPVLIEFDWLTDSAVRIDTTEVTLGDTLTFYRTVSKTTLPVDVTVGGQLTRENVETLHKHVLYVMHEVFDGRFEEYTAINTSVMEIVSAAVTSAVQSSGLIATYTYPVQLSYNGSPDKWPVSNLQNAELKVHVKTNPLSPQEFTVSGENGVIAEFTVNISGEVQDLVYYSVDSGEYVVLETTQNHGATVNVTVEGVLSDYLEFATEFPDFAQQYKELSCL